MNRILPPSADFLMQLSFIQAILNYLVFSVSAVAGWLSTRRGLLLRAAIAVSLWLVGMGTSVGDEPAAAARDFSGWRGGIGITFGTPRAISRT